MANTNNLEFLGREGLKTLLDQVNLNTQSINTVATINAGTYGGWIETGADPELDITFSNEFEAYIRTITDKNDRHYSRVVEVDFTRATITVETMANSGGEDSQDPITIPKGYYFICEKDNVFTGAKKGDYLVSTGSTTIIKPVGLQVDWNQNDPQASDYIKNRTHYFALKDSISESTGFIYGAVGQFTVEESNRFCTQAPDGDICFKPGVYSRTGTGFVGTESEIVSDIGVTSLFNAGIYLSDPAGGPNSCYIVIDGYISGGEDASDITLTYTETELKQLDAKYIPVDNNTITTDADGKLKANIPAYTLSKVDDEIILTGSDGKVTKVTDDKGLIYKESFEDFHISQPPYTTLDDVMCYGNDTLLYFAGYDENYLGYYSKDGGQTWVSNSNLAVAPTSIVFGNNLFVAIQTERTIAYSSDGITWNSKEVECSNATVYWRKVFFNAGKFILVGDYGYIATSTDGLSWTEYEFECDWSSEPYFSAIGNNTLVVACGVGNIASVNLETKETGTAYLSYTHAYKMIFADNKFFLWCDNYDSELWVSEDNGITWNSVTTTQTVTSIYSVKDTLYVIYDGNTTYYYADGSLIQCARTLYEDIASIIDLDRYWVAIASDTMGCYFVISNDGINWSSENALVVSSAYLEQYGQDVTSKVAKLVGGNGGTADLENATLENLTITGALTIDGDLAFGDLDVTTVTAEKVVVSSDPVDDNDVATKKYVDEHSGGSGGSGASGGETYTVSVNTSGASSGTYLKDSAGNQQKILNLYNITTTGSESSITNGRLNGDPGTGIKYTQVFGTGHTIGNNLSSSLIRGQNHTIGSDVNHVDVSGYKNTLANGADYNTIHGTEFNVTGTHNVTFGVGGNCIINGKANMMAGDLTGSTITGNYNTILCGGGQNSITGTTSDPCQHNVILGSTTTLTSAENCLTLGRLNTINNHDRAVLMGIGLTATRDNQLIVGSYNDENRKGGVFIVGNGLNDEVVRLNTDYIVSAGMEIHTGDWLTTSNYYAENISTGEIVHITKTANGWMPNSNVLKFYSFDNGDSKVEYIQPVDDSQWNFYRTNKSNAMIVYKEGTVTIGHDPIGPMDVATKQYVDSHSSSGGVDEEQVRAIVEDVLLNGAW
jgi:hypothetical protein